MDQSDAIREVVDQPALDRNGDEVGRVVDVFVDEATNVPNWVALRIEGRDSLVLAPIGGSDLEARPFRLDVDRDHVLSAPALSPGEQRVSPEEEAEIERHYREPASAVDQTPGRSSHDDLDAGRSFTSDSTLDADRPLGADIEAPVEVVRSEEDLVVDTRVVGGERVRLIKRIVTEQVTRTVEVRHEELVIEREPLTGGVGPAPGDETATGLETSGTQGASAPATRRERITGQLKERLPSLPSGALAKLSSGGGAFSGETTEITLMQEEVVLSKRIVPRERVRVRKAVVTEQRAITDTLRREQVEIEEGARHRGGTGERFDSELDRGTGGRLDSDLDRGTGGRPDSDLDRGTGGRPDSERGREGGPGLV